MNIKNGDIQNNSFEKVNSDTNIEFQTQENKHYRANSNNLSKHKENEKILNFLKKTQ